MLNVLSTFKKAVFPKGTIKVVEIICFLRNCSEKEPTAELVKEEETKKVGLKEMMFMSLSALIFYS